MPPCNHENRATPADDTGEVELEELREQPPQGQRRALIDRRDIRNGVLRRKLHQTKVEVEVTSPVCEAAESHRPLALAVELLKRQRSSCFRIGRKGAQL